ncbi:MAG TPA: four helix bundle protein [Thermodesulfobacteriota bacterium]|jgi:hypothetical protein|nr:four helix bundle protein [Thermodesulfobacteriota bacterium]
MENRKTNIRHFRELDVYKLGMELAMRTFEVSKLFPTEEKYSLTDQMMVCPEQWRIRSRSE